MAQQPRTARFYDRLATANRRRPACDPLEKLELVARVEGGPWLDSLTALRLLRTYAELPKRLKTEKAQARRWLKQNARLLRP